MSAEEKTQSELVKELDEVRARLKPKLSDFSGKKIHPLV